MLHCSFGTSANKHHTRHSSPTQSCPIAGTNVEDDLGEFGTWAKIPRSRSLYVYKQSLAHDSISTQWGHTEDHLNATLDAHTQLMLSVFTDQPANFSTNCLLTKAKSNQASPTPCCPVACTFPRSQGQGPTSLNTLITTKHNSWLQPWIHMLNKARQIGTSIIFADAKLCLQEGILLLYTAGT